MNENLSNKDIPPQSSNQQILSYNDIASKLLADRLILTALELHCELLEGGKELKLLRDHFSNPINFEGQPHEAPLISRCSSQVTLDSLDLTRLSEDGEKCMDERVAVLEFELRKARETINALRNNLTVAIESEASTPDKKTTNESIKPHEQRALNFLINEYLLMHNYKLTSITFSDENEDQDFEDWDDVGLNISKPNELLTLYRDGLKLNKLNKVNVATQADFNELEQQINDLNQQIVHLQDENLKLSKELKHAAFPIKQEVETDEISCVSLNESDWTNITINEFENLNKFNENCHENVTNYFKNLSKQVNITDNYKEHLLNSCLTDVLSNMEEYNRFLHESFTKTLTNSLIKIIPNIILNKREEVIPILVKAIILNSDSCEREKLLTQLFNLKKKPTKDERRIILSGIVSIAKCLGETLVENEILIHCWEQLTHKHIEKRFLVIEACIVLIPHISSSIRNSLILSMLQQMMDDRDEQVREMVYRAFALILALCEDDNKYSQCQELTFRSLSDSSASVFQVCLDILFPVLAKWALSIGRLEGELIKSLLFELNKRLKESNEVESIEILRIIHVLDTLLPFIVFYVANVDVVVNNIEKDMAIELRSDFVKLSNPLTNPSVFFTGDVNVGMIFYEFDKYIGNHPKSTWKQMDWLMDVVLPDLLNNLNHIQVHHHPLLQTILDLFLHINQLFGKEFAINKILPLFKSQLQNLEQILSSFNQYSLTLSLIPVYLVSVLSVVNVEELSEALTRFLCALPLCGAPIDCLEVTVKQLCNLGLEEIVCCCLWDGVVHSRPLVRSSTASLLKSIISKCTNRLITTKITPAIVTLANDSDVLVKTATIPALASLIHDCPMMEIHDKAYMQLQTCLSDPISKENHTFLRQLVITLGTIVISCKTSFREDVIIPNLLNFALYTGQMTNSTRKIDMTLALLESYSKIVHSSISKQNLIANLLPGLRCIETIISENPSLTPHQTSINSMIKEAENRVNLSSGSQSPIANHGIEDMKQRVTKIFSKTPSTKSSLQSMFAKK